MELEDIITKNVTDEICSRINGKILLYATDKKKYYEEEINDSEEQIKKLTKENELYSKEKQDEPLYGYHELVTYREAIGKNIVEIQRLKKYISSCKRKIKKLS